MSNPLLYTPTNLRTLMEWSTDIFSADKAGCKRNSASGFIITKVTAVRLTERCWL